MFLLELFELADVLGFQAGISPLPAIERLLGNPEMTDEVRNRGSQLRPFEHRHDVLDTEACAFHGILLPPLRGMMPETLSPIGTKTAGPTTSKNGFQIFFSVERRGRALPTP